MNKLIFLIAELYMIELHCVRCSLLCALDELAVEINYSGEIIVEKSEMRLG